jgi:hypothetical protein
VNLFDFLSLKNDVNVPSKSNKQKICFKNQFFVGILKINEESSRIVIQDPDPLVRGMDPQHCFKSLPYYRLHLSTSLSATVLPDILAPLLYYGTICVFIFSCFKAFLARGCELDWYYTISLRFRI